MTREFMSSVICGGNTFFPEKIIITDNTFTWKKSKGVFGEKSTVIPLSKIHSVDIDRKMLGGDIYVHFYGSNSYDTKTIVGKHFSAKDLKEMGRILLN
jgi:hypothetical protein